MVVVVIVVVVVVVVVVAVMLSQLIYIVHTKCFLESLQLTHFLFIQYLFIFCKITHRPSLEGHISYYLACATVKGMVFRQFYLG